MSKKKYINADVLSCFYKQVDELQHSPDKISKIKSRFLKNNVIPTIQDYKVENVEEVRHGKWIIKNNERHWQDKDHYSLLITCSECGLTHFLGTTRYANEYNEQKFKDNNYDEYLFCRKCGAKMDKE